jgi:hypothetical protein
MEPREAADPKISWTGNWVDPQGGAGRAGSWERWAGVAGLVLIVLDLATASPLERRAPTSRSPSSPRT